MLQTFFIYQLKVFVCAALLMTYYRAALRNKRFHYYNRFYLLLTVLFSITVPLLNLQWFTFESSSEKAITLLNVIYANGDEEKVVNANNFMPDWQQLCTMILAVVTAIMLTILFARIWKIYKIKRSYPVSSTDEFDFIETDLQHAPFSFLRNIFWRNDISIEETTGKQILQHEITHIQQKHTWDKLFMQTLNAVFWINPVFWLIKGELYLIHEFIADEKAVENKDASAFAAMLLHAQYGKAIFAPAQSFFYSPVKRRLIMLTTSKDARFSYFRRMMALPLLAFVTFLFAFRIQKADDVVAVTKVNAPFKLVVDAGHGGKDAGALGINGIKEKDLNLAIAKEIKELSASYGIEVILTRSGDQSLTPPERVDWIKTQNADACISVHTNAGSNEENKVKSGMEVVISKNNDNGLLDKSKLLGSAVIGELKDDFRVVPALLQKQTGIWILQANSVPSILIESGYLDNKDDVAYLTQSAKIEAIARNILQGVAAYANQKDIKPYEIKSTAMEEAKDTASPKPTPLYVVDGKITDASKAKSLDNNSIKSVNVLKDKSATDKYGDQGKNGVVEIYTKNGENFSVTINKNVNVDTKVNTNTDVNVNTNTNVNTDIRTNVTVTKDVKIALYVIDGKIVTKAEADKLDPNGIKSVNVLKDKSASDKYGEKGKNGVVEITTKASQN